MIRTPPQHQTDPAKAPGIVRNEQTLGDYYVRKGYSVPQEMDNPNYNKDLTPVKLSFDKWSGSKEIINNIEMIDSHYHGWVWHMMELAWKAGQENK